jgi:hypothetical protein
VLYGSTHKEEKDGILHFPNGVFKDCRKYNAAIETRDREQSKLREQIQQLTDKKTNGDSDDSYCILM